MCVGWRTGMGGVKICKPVDLKKLKYLTCSVETRHYIKLTFFQKAIKNDNFNS